MLLLCLYFRGGGERRWREEVEGYIEDGDYRRRRRRRSQTDLPLRWEYLFPLKLGLGCSWPCRRRERSWEICCREEEEGGRWKIEGLVRIMNYTLSKDLLFQTRLWSETTNIPQREVLLTLFFQVTGLEMPWNFKTWFRSECSFKLRKLRKQHVKHSGSRYFTFSCKKWHTSP